MQAGVHMSEGCDGQWRMLGVLRRLCPICSSVLLLNLFYWVCEGGGGGVRGGKCERERWKKVSRQFCTVTIYHQAPKQTISTSYPYLPLLVALQLDKASFISMMNSVLADMVAGCEAMIQDWMIRFLPLRVDPLNTSAFINSS